LTKILYVLRLLIILSPWGFLKTLKALILERCDHFAVVTMNMVVFMQEPHCEMEVLLTPLVKRLAFVL
jgi:hypothetical protein